MYKTIVKVQESSDDKKMLKVLIPIFIWFTLFFISFIITIKVMYVVLPLTLIIFFSIIPIFIIQYRKGEKLKQSWIEKEVTFNVENNELYVDNKNVSVKKSKTKDEIYISHIVHYRTSGLGGSGMYIDLFFKVQEPYINEFINF